MGPTDSRVESIPFLHANQAFTITFVEDLSFAEVRAILDYLIECDAFNPESQEHRGPYDIDAMETSFRVWVQEMEVMIVRP